jgi:hypothetical protein
LAHIPRPPVAAENSTKAAIALLNVSGMEYFPSQLTIFKAAILPRLKQAF